MRSLDEYKKQCTFISRNGISDSERIHFSKVYGINRPSILVDLPQFDVTRQLPQDLMHVLLEGIFPLHLEQLLQHVVEVAGLLTLDQLNSRITEFPYAYFSNKPGHLKGFDPQGSQTGN